MQLRDYQLSIATDASKLLAVCNIAYLSMEVRTGKSLTALAAAAMFGAKDVVFVTKKKAIASIESDYAALNPAYKLTVINYEQLHNYEGNPDLVIIDEAHSLGQFPKPSERTKLLKSICEGNPIIFLSGTPTPESYSQLYHQFYVSSFSPFKEYKNFYAWAKEFVTIKKRYFFNREINDYSHAKKEAVQNHTKHLFISYTQEEAGFKQKVEEEILLVRMRKSTYWLANKMIKDRVHIGSTGEEVLADTEVKLQNKLHQIYSGTVKSESGERIAFDNSKADFIREYFAGQKIAIFYKFIAEYAHILWAFGANRITNSPEEFNASTDKIFVSQIQSGREGVNLSTADALVMFNIDFAAVSYLQARDRLQTKDRIKPAKVYWIFAENGIEQKIYNTVSKKLDYTISYFRKDYQLNKSVKI